MKWHWNETLDRLRAASGHTIMRIGLRGSGASTPSAANAAIIEDADEMLELLRDLGGERRRVCVLCHCSGGEHDDECRIGALLAKHGRG